MRQARVQRHEIEADLVALRAEVADPRAGIFGPGTMAWEVSREAAVFLGAGRAALLQLAHPFVAGAISEHSVTRSDPAQRFRATFQRIFRMVFGDLDEAVAAAREVYATHSKIRGALDEDVGRFAVGERYDARDREAKVWVLATLWDTSLFVFDRVVRPLTRAEREQFYAESRRFARLFGVADDLPATYADFERYVERTLAGDMLGVSRRAAEIGRVILRPQNLVGRIVRDDYGTFTAHLLPERLARGFGLDRGGASGQKRYETILMTTRRLLPHLPDHARFIPAYIEAVRRIEGKTGRDRLGELVSRLYVGQARLGGDRR
ncbi:MAG: oxygenase MpaB family protein [Polyangiaceae bacterium]